MEGIEKPKREKKGFTTENTESAEGEKIGFILLEQGRLFESLFIELEKMFDFVSGCWRFAVDAGWFDWVGPSTPRPWRALLGMTTGEDVV